MQIYRLNVNRNTCSGCNVCVVSCPINFDQLKLKGELTKKNAVLLVKNGMAYDIYEEERKFNCDGCGVCIKCCPQSAISLEIIEVK